MACGRGAGVVIHGVTVQPLTRIKDARGEVMHMLRSDSPLFHAFGEIYFSRVLPGVIKAWKRHGRITQHLAVPVGSVRFGLYDDRAESPSSGTVQVLEVGEGAYELVRIPPGIWYGFQGLGRDPSLVANCTDLPYDPVEVERRDPNDPRMPAVWFPPRP